ncbi:MAG: hypothetical protein MI919_29205 [Holophagales bacterium]|nr:hypothetical protein [Holophagales bacterium]
MMLCVPLVSALGFSGAAQASSCISADAPAISEAHVTPLFVTLEPSPEAGDSVQFIVRVGGDVFLTESVQVLDVGSWVGNDMAQQAPEKDGGASSTGIDWISDAAEKIDPASAACLEDDDFSVRVIELLSAQPRRLAHLRNLAETTSVDIVISHRGGVEVRSLSELDAAGLDSDSAVDWRPLGNSSRVAGANQELPTISPGKPLAPQRSLAKSACTDHCDSAQDDCYDYCGQFGGASCYNACDSDWSDCRASCGSCQPSSSSVTTYTTLSSVLLYAQCRKGNLPWEVKGMYGYYLDSYKKTVVTTTINSDCSQTVSQTVTYPQGYCWRFYYSSPFCTSLGNVWTCQ